MSADLFASNEIVSRSNVNDRITAINNMFPVSVDNGGTGGTSATAARTNLEVMTGVQIYYNASGTTGTIALYQSIANFQIVEIFFTIPVGAITYSGSTRVYNGGDAYALTTMTLNAGGTYSSQVRVRVFACSAELSADSITRPRDQRAYITGTNTTIAEATTTDTPLIYKVVGYKY